MAYEMFKKNTGFVDYPKLSEMKPTESTLLDIKKEIWQSVVVEQTSTQGERVFSQVV